MYQALTQEEWEWEECKVEHSLFMECLHQWFHFCGIVKDLVELGVEGTMLSEITKCQNIPNFGQRTRGNPRVGGAMSTFKTNKGQNGQWLSGLLEAKCQWYSNW